MPNRSVDFTILLIEDLKDPEESVGFLNALLDEYNQDDDVSKEILLDGLNCILRAQVSLATQKAVKKNYYQLINNEKIPQFSTFLQAVNLPNFTMLIKNINNKVDQQTQGASAETDLYTAIHKAEQNETSLPLLHPA